MIKLVNQQHLNLADLDDQQMNDMIDEVTAKVLDTTLNPQFAILESSARMGYIRHQLIKTMHQMGRTLHEQSRRTALRPRRTEVQFGLGDQQGLQPLVFDLDADQPDSATPHRQVLVRGRIDRLDELKLEEKTFLGIVDYKSSEHQFDYQSAYYGQAMQMLTYLDAVKRNLSQLVDQQEAPSTELAGAVYLHLQNPVLKAGDILNQDPLDALLKAEQYQGLLLDDTDFLDHIEEWLTTSKYSKLFRGLLKKKSGGYSSPKPVTPDELDNLLAHTERLIKTAALEILEGHLDLAPVREQNRTALQFSPYKSIMQFDPLLPENNYHNLTSLKKADIMTLIEQERQQNAADEMAAIKKRAEQGDHRE